VIDVHIIERDDPNEEWLRQALNSIPQEICTTHCFKAGGKSIAENRVAGFALGTKKYVSFVDDDDYVLAGTFERCLAFLEADPHYAAVGSFEQISSGGEIISPDIDRLCRKDKNHWDMLHHIIVFRRDKVEKYLHVMKDKKFCEYNLKQAMKDDGHLAKILPIVGYVWRRHGDSYCHSKKS